MHLTPKLKLWICTKDAQGVFGAGKFKLLKTIQEKGSLSAAADHLKISYRKAWGSLKKAEEHLGVKLIEKTRGGANGGQSTITPTGEKLLEAYSLFTEEMQQHLTKTYNETLKDLFNDDF